MLQKETLLLRPYERANGHYTVTFLRYLLRHHPDQQLVIFWDGATYHRYGEMIEFLRQVNQGLTEDQWKVTCVFLAPHAPQENPVEDVWLKGQDVCAAALVPRFFLRQGQATLHARHQERAVFRFSKIRSIHDCSHMI